MMRKKNLSKIEHEKRSKRRQRRRNNSLMLQPSISKKLCDMEHVKKPDIFDLSLMVRICQSNWSMWLTQVSSARVQQVTVLSEKPSMENIEMLQDLEKLGTQTVSYTHLTLPTNREV